MSPEGARHTPSAASLRRYQDLDGGSGRAVHFRPRRDDPAQLGVEAIAHVIFDDVQHPCTVRDLAVGGLSFVSPAASGLRRGDRVPLALSVGGEALYRGAAEVVWQRPDGAAALVGVKLLDGALDVACVHALGAVSGLALGAELVPRPWHVVGYETFKARVAELALLLADTRRMLDALEPHVPREVREVGSSSPVRRAFFARLRWFVTEFAERSAEIDRCVRQASAEDRAHLKELSRRYLHDFLMQAPWMKRALDKPRGYPGDYELMNGLYGERYVGDTLFAQALNAALVSTPPGEAVRQRKNVIKGRLHALLDATPASDRPLRILSIAAGPAEEVYELLRERHAVPCPVEIVLFDQDEDALAFAHARLQRSMRERPLPGVHVRFLHDSIKRLLRDPSLNAEWGELDFIFSCGLYDYLQPPTAAALTQSLYSSLRPAGSLYIGNMVPTNPGRWFMDFHLDWELLYKQPDAMLDFARKGAPDAALAIVPEPTGVNPFVRIERPR